LVAGRVEGASSGASASSRPPSSLRFIGEKRGAGGSRWFGGVVRARDQGPQNGSTRFPAPSAGSAGLLGAPPIHAAHGRGLVRRPRSTSSLLRTRRADGAGGPTAVLGNAAYGEALRLRGGAGRRSTGTVQFHPEQKVDAVAAGETRGCCARKSCASCSDSPEPTCCFSTGQGRQSADGQGRPGPTPGGGLQTGEIALEPMDPAVARGGAG